MSDFGVDSVTGFNLKRLADIKSSLESLLEQVVDPESGEYLQVDFDEDDPFIQIINILIDQYTTLWELAQIVYGQFNPTIAAGPSLSGLVQLNGIVRKSGTKSSVILTLSGSNGLRIPSGTQFSDADGEVTWELTADVYLDSLTGTADATAYSVENGSFIYAAGEINTIVTIVSGLNAVVNNDVSIAGEADESDDDLRRRRRQSTTTPAQSIPEAIRGALMNLEDVTLCRIYVNNTLTTDSNGIPAKTLAAVIVGGDDDKIAEIIFTRLGVAVATYGNTHVTFTDSLRQNNVISFVRPVSIPVYVAIDITVIDTYAYPSDAQDQIKANIIAYATDGASALGVTDEDNFDQDGILPGEDVVVSRL
ncbi:MAG: baseplate J/gp47 family protein, partial [Candidatus Aenigmarchaeota archaeon]|nr:baseplate J/gp47 family protein [Candidatus Aenigmarchaeota archaeon]